MRLLKFLKESELNWENIKSLCPKSVDASEKYNSYLYRGSRDLEGDMGKAYIRKDRKPTNSPIQYHDFINTGFKKIFGINLRSESLFCTGNYAQAKSYGRLFEIFPSDDYTLYWSPNIVDLYSIHYFNEKLTKDYELAFATIREITVWKDISKLLENSKMQVFFEKSNLMETLSKYKNKALSESEITEAKNAVLTKYPNCAADFIKANYKKGTTQKDFEEAAKSKKEIMITASFYCYKKAQI